MRKVIFGINISADGYCGHGDMNADEQVHRYFTDLLKKSSLLLYGRATYQLMVPFWPTIARDQSASETTNEFARIFDSLDMVVFSTTLKEVEGKNRRLAQNEIATEVMALRQQPGKDICVGSLSLGSQLSQHRLIDEYRFVVHPTIVGKGPRLFETMRLQDNLRLELLNSETFQSGAIALHYKLRA